MHIVLLLVEIVLDALIYSFFLRFCWKKYSFLDSYKRLKLKSIIKTKFLALYKIQVFDKNNTFFVV